MPDGAQLPALPTDLDVDGARLPAVYESAKFALAECDRIDECKEWASKAEALASYARQMNDTTMREMADRIQARAIRRAGELVEQVPPAANQHPAGEGGHTGRFSAARDAGLSRHQTVQALRVARVPPAEFEAAVERPDPATVTELAERGKQSRPASEAEYLGGRDPADFQQGTKLGGLVATFVRDGTGIDLQAAVRGLWPAEVEKLRNNITLAKGWLVAVEGVLGGNNGL